RLPLGIVYCVAADGVDRIRAAEDEMVGGIGIALAPEPVRVRQKREPLARLVDLDSAAILIFAFAEHSMAEDEEAAGRTLDRDLPLQRRLVAGGDRPAAHESAR